MGQTLEEVRKNIVRIMDKNGTSMGTGFLLTKEYCVTCHHNICNLNKIYVGRDTNDKISVEWVEEKSNMKKDIAILKIKQSKFNPLNCSGDTFSKLPVLTRGFPTTGENDEDNSGIISGQLIRGVLDEGLEDFRWNEEQIDGNNRWNKKPEVRLEVYPIKSTDQKKFVKGFSGAPIIHEHDIRVVGMLEAKDDERGYIIPIQEILELIKEDQQAVSNPTNSIDAGNIINQGNEFLKNHDYEQAIKKFDSILTDPNIASAFYNKGIALTKLGKDTEALECYDKSLEIDPNYGHAWYNKGTALSKLGKHTESIECYDKAIEIDPNYGHAWDNKGASLGMLGKYLESIECHDKATEIDPNHRNAWNNKGTSFSDLDKHTEALECYDKSLEIDPNYVLGWNNKGTALSKLGKHTESIECYDKAIEIDPNNGLAWDNKGAVLSKLGKHTEALECYDKAIEIDPNNGLAWDNKGISLQHLGNSVESKKCFTKAKEINSN